MKVRTIYGVLRSISNFVFPDLTEPNPVESMKRRGLPQEVDKNFILGDRQSAGSSASAISSFQYPEEGDSRSSIPTVTTREAERRTVNETE
jgi:hypothetical protein